eukprot:scaffold8361_cov118-Isochrysis_galbana.AAC.3
MRCHGTAGPHTPPRTARTSHSHLAHARASARASHALCSFRAHTLVGVFGPGARQWGGAARALR